ncbi:MAG: endonuclease/exonuclease/phosphatase family protein [Alistipes sp.]|nr:endonuclease/exonuclease/phosphatase family protein [Alistipes sp.]
MGDYYKSSYTSSGGRRRNQRSAAGLIIDIFVGVITLVVVALFLTTLFVPSLDPRQHGEVSTLGLVAPIIYAMQAALTLYWIVRWRPFIAVVMVFVSLLGVFQLSLFYKLELRRVYSEPNLKPRYDKKALKVMSYNVRSFIDDNRERQLDSIVKIIKAVNPDILCIQEMGFSDIADSLLEPLKPMPHSLSRVNLSPAIYSRYPIIRASRMDTLKNFVWADIVIKKDKNNEDTIRVFNNHLHSTAIRRDDSNYIENHEYLEGDSLGKVHSMVKRLTENNRVRAEQADTLAALVAASPYPVIVCGDFNDTPVSYTYRTVARKLNDPYRKVGRGYSHTYRGFFDMLRIDYIFYSDEFEALSYEVVDSWGLEQSVVGRGENADTVLVKAYGNRMNMPNEEQLREAMIIPADSITLQKIDNRIKYSDHYPVFVRLLYKGKNH